MVLEPVDEFVQELGLSSCVLLEVLGVVKIDLLAQRVPPENATPAVTYFGCLFF